MGPALEKLATGLRQVPALLALMVVALLAAPAAALETVPFERAGVPSAAENLAALPEARRATEIADIGESPDAVGSDDAPIPAQATAVVATPSGPSLDPMAAPSVRGRRSGPYRARAPPAG